MLYFLLFTLLALLFFPDLASTGATEALRLCGTAVIPALFPFFLLTRLLSSYLPMPKKGPAYLPALLVSFLGGYPVGISTVVSLYENGQLSKHEAERALRICNNSGPGFFVAVVGGAVLHSRTLGLVLYGIHILSALLCAAVWNDTASSRLVLHRVPQKVGFPQRFQQALEGACTAMLQVCGLVIVFSVVLALLRPGWPGQVTRPPGVPATLPAQWDTRKGFSEDRKGPWMCALHRRSPEWASFTSTFSPREVSGQGGQHWTCRVSADPKGKNQEKLHAAASAESHLQGHSSALSADGCSDPPLDCRSLTTGSPPSSSPRPGLQTPCPGDVIHRKHSHVSAQHSHL